MQAPTHVRDDPHTWEAYERMAGVYDAFTAHHDHELWLSNLLPVAEELGWSGERVLDLACGTGKSFEPLLNGGRYEITGCDFSEAMLARAAERCDGRVRLELADVRSLPELGEFDLVLCLGDVFNYMLSAEEIERALMSVSRNLAPGGVFVFDMNTIHAYRTWFATSESHGVGDWQITWRGGADANAAEGVLVEGRVEIADLSGEIIDVSVHRQRHHPLERVCQLVEAVDLNPAACFGHGYDAKLERPLDEARHTKAVFFVTR